MTMQPIPTLVTFRKRRIRLKICARQVIEQHVDADVEQITPPPYQAIKYRLLVGQQPVVTPIQLTDLWISAISQPAPSRSIIALRANHSLRMLHSLPGPRQRYATSTIS